MYDEYARELGRIYEQSLKKVKENGFSAIPNRILEPTMKGNIEKLIDRVDNFKAVTSVTITSTLKKIITPDQDIRLHKVEFENGYSGRSLDTAVVTPFLKDNNLKCMAESGWLTRSLEQTHPFSLDFPGAIRDQEIKDAFLQIINDIETKGANAEAILDYLLQLLIIKRESEKIEIRKIENADIYISEIIEKLTKHFKESNSSGTARLPVLAVYSIYECLMNQIARFQGKVLKPLESHTSADLRSNSIGDIQVDNEEGTPFEGVEVKYGKPITHSMLEDAYGKFGSLPVKRYYLLSTAEPEEEEKKLIEDMIRKIKEEHGCQVIVNGLLPTIKYYLRLLEEPTPFLNKYTDNVLNDEVVKLEHKQLWKEILENS
jgi:DNA (cytosine-5)-methyltransferase 1